MLGFFYRAAYYTLLKMSKLLLTVVGYAQVTVVAEAIQPSDPTCTPPPVSASAHNAAVILQQALQYIPNPATECMLRNMAVRLAGHLSNLVSIHVRGGIWLACESGWNSVMSVTIQMKLLQQYFRVILFVYYEVLSFESKDEIQWR